MDEEIVISLQNISKCYKRYPRPVDRLKEIVLPKKSYAQEFWALRDINLQVPRGETLGIVGQNGSGKSTLLQVIAKTLTPTTGEVAITGRVSALLELGSGFNPEFTGRQNVFFNGQILGLSREEIAAKFEEIAGFADIGDFIDQPVKTYSSGMYVRLGFAVAVIVNPDILIVDEALAVGDIYFQQKCFNRIRKLKESGTTILFVSHDSAAVHKLCNRALLMERGNLILDANPRQVIDLYEAKILQKRDIQPESFTIAVVSEHQNNTLADTDQIASADFTDLEEIVIDNSEVILKFVKFLDAADQEIEVIVSEEFLQISIGILFRQGFADPHIGFKIRERTGEVIFETNTYCMGQKIGSIAGETFLDIRFQFNVPLMAGEYTITVGVADSGFGEGSFQRTLFYAHNVAVLKVLKNKDSILWSGVVNLLPSVSVRNKLRGNNERGTDVTN